jgi:hypothetical protein
MTLWVEGSVRGDALSDRTLTVHCKLDNLGHQSAVRPGNGTGPNSARFQSVSDQPRRVVLDLGI